MKQLRHNFRGKRYGINFRSPRNKGHIGICDYENKEIKISPKITGVEKLDCIIHEALHACMPDLSDDAVNESATCMAKLLWKLGYNQKGEDK